MIPIWQWEKGEIPSDLCDYIVDTFNKNEYDRGKTGGWGEEAELEPSKRQVDMQFSSMNWINALLCGYIRYANHANFHYNLSDIDRELVQISKYSKDDFYQRHIDYGEGKCLTRKLSLTIQLSDENDYEGGDLKFYTGIWNPRIEESEETYAQASRGKVIVIVFDSRSIHDVTPITSCTRYSLVKWYHGDEPLK